MKCSALGTPRSVVPPFSLCVGLQLPPGSNPALSCGCSVNAKRTHSKRESGLEEVSLKQMLSPDAVSKALKQQTSTHKQSLGEIEKILPWP